MQLAPPSRPSEYVRLDLMRVRAASLFPGEAVATCGRFLSPRVDAVEVLQSVRDGRICSSFSGLRHCDDPLRCPSCSHSRAVRDAEELSEAVKAAALQGLTPFLVTLTFAHSRGDDLLEIRGRFSLALSDMRSGRAWVAFCERWGVPVWYRALECTYSDRNGFHPHAHELWFLPRLALLGDHFAGVSSATMLARFQSELRALYYAALASQGLSASDAVGLQVEVGRDRVAQYIVKRGEEYRSRDSWEVAGSRFKKGREKGLTQWQLLERATFHADPAERARYAGLFAVYVRAFAGARMSRWSNGAYVRLFGHRKDLSDCSEDEKAVILAARKLTAEVERGKVVARIKLNVWLAVLHFRGRGVVLWLATLPDAEMRLHRYLRAIEVAYAARRAPPGGLAA